MPKYTPYPQQVEAEKYLQDNLDAGKHWGLLYMHPRLGKSHPMVRHITKNRLAPVLIICPSIAMYAWADIFEQFGVPKDKILVFAEGTKKQRDKKLDNIKKYPVVLSTYESTKGYDLLMVRKWKAVVADESHRIGRIQSANTQYFIKSSAGFTRDAHKFCLTGTPAMEHRLRLIPQYLWATSKFGAHTSYPDFILNHCEKSMYGDYRFVQGRKMEKAMDAYVAKTAFSRTRKACGVGATKIYSKVYVGISQSKTAKLYRGILDGSIKNYEKQLKTKVKEMEYNPLSKYGHLLSCCSDRHPDTGYAGITLSNKAYAVSQIVQNSADDEQFVIFGYYRDEVRSAYGHFSGQAVHWKTPSDMIIGGMKPKDLHAKLEKFSKGETRLMFCQVDAAKEGVDLSSAKTIIFISNSFKGITRAQAEDRVIHPGQKIEETVQIIDVVCRRGVDEVVVDLLRDKIQINDAVLSTKLSEVGEPLATWSPR